MKIIRKTYFNDEQYCYNLQTFFETKSLKNYIAKETIDADLLNAAIFFCTNLERARMHIPLCEFHKLLRDSAIIHSAQMKIYDFFDHNNPYNPEYRSMTDRINSVTSKANISFNCNGENIADYPILKTDGNKFIVRNFLNKQRFFAIDGIKEIYPYTYEEFARAVVNGWMNSPGHRENIINPQYKFLGCAAVLYEKKNNFVSVPMISFKITQNFGGEIIQRNSKGKEKKFKIGQTYK